MKRRNEFSVQICTAPGNLASFEPERHEFGHKTRWRVLLIQRPKLFDRIRSTRWTRIHLWLSRVVRAIAMPLQNQIHEQTFAIHHSRTLNPRTEFLLIFDNMSMVETCSSSDQKPQLVLCKLSLELCIGRVYLVKSHPTITTDPEQLEHRLSNGTLNEDEILALIWALPTTAQ